MPIRPILFSAPMVRALLAGTKTQTRRIFDESKGNRPRFEAGDVLWVRETWSHTGTGVADTYRAGDGEVIYAADGGGGPWWPSIHMPKAYSRLTLHVTDVRVQRLQDISADDADAECFGGDFPHSVLPELFPDADEASQLSLPECYGRLWDSINGPGSWDTNPRVVAVSFTVHKGNIDALNLTERAAA